MTTDRELLEWAAKAYWGDEIDDVCSIRWLEEDQAIGYTHGDNQDHNGEEREFVWNPLVDDGDALRLAVKCRIEIDHSHAQDQHRYVCASRRGCEMMYAPVSAVEEIEDDGQTLAATRRAIVRAAASIGQQKEGG